MKVSDLRFMKIRGPIPHDEGGVPGTISKYILRVDTDAGVYGLGEAEDFMGVREGLEYCRAALIGRNPFDIKPFVSEVRYGALPPYDPRVRPFQDPARFAQTYPLYKGGSPTAIHTGPITWALSGVEMALCDLVGKALGTPAYNLFGGRWREAAKIYLDRSAPDAEQGGGEESWKSMALESIEDDFSHIKFDLEHLCAEATRECWNRSLGPRQLEMIVARLTAVRDAVGPAVELCVDGHTMFSLPTAIRLAQELAPLKLTWLEDLTSHVDLDACVELRRKSPTPLCLGEMFTCEQFRTFIDHGAVDILHPDVLFVGGMHEMHRIGEYADLHQLQVAIHTNGGALAAIASAHVAVATRTFIGQEYHFIEADWIGAYVRREGVPLFRSGHIPLSDAPGLGVELDREVCMRVLAPGESYIG